VDTRPDGKFDQEGICPACRFTEQMKKYTIDFSERKNELSKIISWAKKNKTSSYDCIVTVSGGKDSMKQAFYARDELKLKPLLVSSMYPPEQLTERGAANLSNLVSHGFDTITMSLNPKIWKKIMREGFLSYGNQAKSTEMALYSIPIHLAIAYKIPLLFLGENPLYTMGQQEGTSVGGDAAGMQFSRTLEGGPDVLMTKDMNSHDVRFYRYPSTEEIQKSKLRVIYLGYYIEEWSNNDNAKFAIERGLTVRTEPPEKIGDYYGHSSLDDDFKIVNQMIKYIKFGFGSVTDQLMIAVNTGEMTREEGLKLVKQFDGKCDESYIQEFCNYLEISEENFWDVVESYRGKEVWEKNTKNEWSLRSELSTP
jgi:N-acetyl sugar amidotransferase